MAAVFWLIGGIALIAAEVLSGDFFLLMVGVGALLGAGAEWITGNTLVAAAVFATVSIGLVTFARPWLKRRMHGDLVATNVDALIGRKAVAVSPVNEHGGQVRLDGDVWTARAFNGKAIAAGEPVTVVEISGATAVVLADGD
ncbi:NfeD family protein [Actinophytocola gossypii]|uniref:NfeD family protein n=1 Tax=Actinophytocola gossypii TaxID=2812003 RepID=A0ABT2J1G2_9PSEU|nr:NfeD family protein [Actinophytocola gossypii]MCT2581697.1 NfeD family protein [Actinophytocola gossypii]